MWSYAAVRSGLVDDVVGLGAPVLDLLVRKDQAQHLAGVGLEAGPQQCGASGAAENSKRQKDEERERKTANPCTPTLGANPETKLWIFC